MANPAKSRGSSPWSADWQPERCYVCGGRVLKTRGPDAGSCYRPSLVPGGPAEVFVWHFACAKGPPSRKGEAA